MSEWQPGIIMNGHNTKDPAGLTGKKVHVREIDRSLAPPDWIHAKCERAFLVSPEESWRDFGDNIPTYLCEHEILTD